MLETWRWTPVTALQKAALWQATWRIFSPADFVIVVTITTLFFIFVDLSGFA